MVPPGLDTRSSSPRTAPVVGGEDRSEGGGDHVELAFSEGKCLGVRLHPLELDASTGTRLGAAGIEVLGREV